MHRSIHKNPSRISPGTESAATTIPAKTRATFFPQARKQKKKKSGNPMAGLRLCLAGVAEPQPTGHATGLQPRHRHGQTAAILPPTAEKRGRPRTGRGRIAARLSCATFSDRAPTPRPIAAPHGQHAPPPSSNRTTRSAGFCQAVRVKGGHAPTSSAWFLPEKSDAGTGVGLPVVRCVSVQLIRAANGEMGVQL